MDNIRVLIVEDQLLSAVDLEAMVLESVPAKIRFATSVAEAKVEMRQPVDFVFLDMVVADGKTFELAGELLRRSVPFAFVTGSQQSLLPASLRRMPFVVKPAQPEQIALLLMDR